jgi:hypothetical protein
MAFKAVSEITVKRKSQFMDSSTSMDILVNGYLAQTLKNGETKTIGLSTNGDIQLQAHLMVNKTPPVLLSEADRKEYIFLVEHVISNTIFFIGLGLAAISTILVIYTQQLIYILIAMPPAFFHLYYRYFKKDRYLRIRKVKKAVFSSLYGRREQQ